MEVVAVEVVADTAVEVAVVVADIATAVEVVAVATKVLESKAKS